RGNPARAFLTAVAQRRAASPDLADALPAHRLVDAVYRSARVGGDMIRDLDREE
ncbi:MAG: hypothetical protein JST73_05995, partial [Actinobacteria bacterium]|nr:hypothetical protein [Actinomycetota bacterium]